MPAKLQCWTRSNKSGAAYVTCKGGNKAAPKGKNTANKKKKSIPAGMAKKSKPAAAKSKTKYTIVNGKMKKKSTKLSPINAFAPKKKKRKK